MICVVESLNIPFLFKSGTPFLFYMFIIAFLKENFKYRYFYTRFP